VVAPLRPSCRRTIFSTRRQSMVRPTSGQRPLGTSAHADRSWRRACQERSSSLWPCYSAIISVGAWNAYHSSPSLSRTLTAWILTTSMSEKMALDQGAGMLRPAHSAKISTRRTEAPPSFGVVRRCCCERGRCVGIACILVPQHSSKRRYDTVSTILEERTNIDEAKA
jgi:hypothetical protein